MSNEHLKTEVIVLAGGEGKRMASDHPKVLVQAKGKPMIQYLLASIEKAEVTDTPTIVVGYKKEEVMNELGDKYNFVFQDKQLGTGHAVMMAEESIKKEADHVLVLYGDHPLISPDTIKKLLTKHLETRSVITMATAKLPDFDDWRKCFYPNFSRIVRDQNGNIEKDVQFKDASEEEKKILEVNPCYFVFDASWLWNKLKILENKNAQKEYYLTDLVQIAIKEKLKIDSIDIDPKEALGANSLEELATLENFIV